jgi:hypothetical protein
VGLGRQPLGNGFKSTAHKRLSRVPVLYKSAHWGEII